MGEYLNQIPQKIESYIKEITKTSDLPFNEESVEKIAKIWLEKKRLFESQISSLHMEEVDSFGKEDKRGALMLTFSGSLVSIGTLRDERREAEYASIGLRSDVPDIAKSDNALLANDITINVPIEFFEGPIRKTSPLLKIAVCPEDVAVEEQEKRIREATIFLTNGFVKINRTIISHPGNLPDQFTMKSMIAYVAAKNDLTQKSTRQIIDDFLSVVESGVLLGEKVPVGKIGRIFLRKRAAQKARVGRNPATGEEITISAKPETMVPNATFSKYLKEKAGSVAQGEEQIS